MQFTHEMYSNTRSTGIRSLYTKEMAGNYFRWLHSSDKHRSLVADITPAPGQGESSSFLFESHTLAQNATAQGTGALYTEAILNVEEMTSFL